jgi:hypothetical protein
MDHKTTGANTMSKEDELRETLNETAKELARLQGNPRTWLSWVVYLLARLEEHATTESASDKEAFLEMLSALQDEIRSRRNTGGWH